MTVIVVLLIILGAVVYWRVSLYFWPTSPCRRCEGSGKNIGSNADRWGKCRKCGGTGKRTRLGAKPE